MCAELPDVVVVAFADRASDEGDGERLGEFEVRAVPVRLPDAGHTAACDDFHDEPRGVRLVDALGVEQGRVGYQDRGQPDFRDQQLWFPT